MNNFVKITFLFLFLTGTTMLSAQKFGHMNAGNFLESMPEVRLADSLLVLYQDTLANKGKLLYDAFEKDYKAYIEEANKGTLPPIQAQQKEAALQKQNEEIEKYRSEAQRRVDVRRQSLLRPILLKIDTAVKAVGKENNYTFIFDTSNGSMLFALDSEDITPMVKKKLGMK
jgi:outer membrane protein